MGAGNAKGAGINNDDDSDDVSVASEVWDRENKPVKEKRNPTLDITATAQKIIVVESDLSDEEADTEKTMTNVKAETRKASLFGFGRKKSEEKAAAIVHEDEEESRSADKKGFRLFSWKRGSNKKPEESDEGLQQDIKELESTFEALGIMSHFGFDKRKDNHGHSQRTKSADDLANLEPMRKRKNVKIKGLPARPINGVALVGLGESLSSGGSRRTFRYSWETDPVPVSEQNDWHYQQVAIDGFDIEKYRLANRGGPSTITVSPPLLNTPDHQDFSSSNNRFGSDTVYDTSEQKMLASIERDFGL